MRPQQVRDSVEEAVAGMIPRSRAPEDSLSDLNALVQEERSRSRLLFKLGGIENLSILAVDVLVVPSPSI